MDLIEAAQEIQALENGSLTRRVASLESLFRGQTVDSAQQLCEQNGITESALEAAFVLKSAACQVNVLIHALGILIALPHILSHDERVEALSLGAGNTGRLFDLETTHRVAEFKFIRWRGGPEAIRQNSLFKDFFYLAEAKTEKQRFLYLLELDRPLRFLTGRRALPSILSKDQKLRDDFHALYSEDFAVVSEYFAHRCDRVKLCNLTSMVPEFGTWGAVL